MVDTVRDTLLVDSVAAAKCAVNLAPESHVCWNSLGVVAAFAGVRPTCCQPQPQLVDLLVRVLLKPRDDPARCYLRLAFVIRVQITIRFLYTRVEVLLCEFGS